MAQWTVEGADKATGKDVSILVEAPDRERAREVFALRGAWNTEENNGILIDVHTNRATVGYGIATVGSWKLGTTAGAYHASCIGSTSALPPA